MPLIIDTCTFKRIFPRGTKRLASYEAIHQWINSDKCLLATGGSKYKLELKNAPSFIPYFVELSKKRQLHNLNDKAVDDLAKKIKHKVNCNDLDDEHIIAISILSKAQAVCTMDERAEKFLKNSALYPKGTSKPKILKENTPPKSTLQILNSCL